MKIWTMDVEKNVKSALEFAKLLKRNKLKGEFYICGKIVEKNPKAIKKISKYHEIGGHGYEHESFGALSELQQLKAIYKTKKAFESIGLSINLWRFPNFSFTNKSFHLLVRAGIKKDSSLKDSWVQYPTLAIWLKTIKYEHKIEFPYLFPKNLKELPWNTVDLGSDVDSLRGRIVLHCYNYPKIKEKIKEILER